MSGDRADGGGPVRTSASDELAVLDVVTDLYAAYLEGDRTRLMGHIDDSCTMWDSTRVGLGTKAELEAARAAANAVQNVTEATGGEGERAGDVPAEGHAPGGEPGEGRAGEYPEPIALETREASVRLFADAPDLALETHTLIARFADARFDEELRCTSLLRRFADGWRFIHHHEELLTGPGRPLPSRTLPH